MKMDMQVKSWMFYFLVGVVLLTVTAGCGTAESNAQTPKLAFETPMNVGLDGALHISLGVRNAGSQTFEGDEQFDGQMTLRQASGELRASAEIVTLPPLEPGEMAWPMNWDGKLNPGSYQLTWGADSYGFTAVDFTVVEREGQLYLLDDTPEAPAAPEPTADAGETISSLDDLVAQAIADLQARLGMAEEAMTVQQIEETEFPDASLGVPEPGQMYAQVVTPGYVIQLEAMGQVYEYHAAGDRVVLVPSKQPHATAVPAIEPTESPTVDGNELTSALTVDEELVADWQVFRDGTYGFQFKYPPNWTYKEMATEEPGVPDDWPLERTVIFFPQAWAERFERSGPPDPEAPPAIPAISLEVYVGPEAQYRRAHVEPNLCEQMNVGGNLATREQEIVDEQIRLIRYVFQPVDDDQLRVVLSDNYSGFADRVPSNEDIVARIPQVVATFEFIE